MSSLNLFSTPIYKSSLISQPRILNKLNQQLLTEIEALSQEDSAGIEWSEKNYINGFTSYASANQMHIFSSTFGELETYIRKHVYKYARSLHLNVKSTGLQMSTCWVNVMEQQGSHSGHIHPHSVISGTYYVQMPKKCSAIRFEDPRYNHFMSRPPVTTAAPEKYQTHYSLPAQAGEVVLFESWLRHEVPLNDSKEPRVSISFNY